MTEIKRFKHRYARPGGGWKIAGDAALFILPSIIVALENAPDVSESLKYWGVQACAILMASAKYLTNLLADIVERKTDGNVR